MKQKIPLETDPINQKYQLPGGVFCPNSCTQMRLSRKSLNSNQSRKTRFYILCLGRQECREYILEIIPPQIIFKFRLSGTFSMPPAVEGAHWKLELPLFVVVQTFNILTSKFLNHLVLKINFPRSQKFLFLLKLFEQVVRNHND